ncbi:MAG: hypothetical protein QOG87_3402, partial [Actinomycetota bacterium]
MAWRPPYQPQLPQTTWGSLARRHWGQTLRGGASSFQLEARRLRVFAFDVFFLGTAMSASVLFQLVERGPPGVAIRGFTG